MGFLPSTHTNAVITSAPSNIAIQGPYKPIPTGMLPMTMDKVATKKVYGLVVRTCSPRPQPGGKRQGGGGGLRHRAFVGENCHGESAYIVARPLHFEYVS